MGVISCPKPLSDEHDTSLFDCGNKTLTEWLNKKALKNQGTGASRTFVVCENHRVIAYYALSTGCVDRFESPGNIRRNMPDPIPVIVLGRLAVDVRCQKRHLGKALLKDAMLRILSISQDAGVRTMLVHAISAEAKHFYLRYGFQESPMDSMTLFLSMGAIKKAIQ